jgi:hypothetical protein
MRTKNKRNRRNRKQKMRSRKRVKRGGKRRSKKSSYRRVRKGRKVRKSKRVSLYIKRRKKKSACVSRKKKSAYIKKYKKKYNKKRRIQLGCSKQRGGNYACEYPKNMGEIITGTPLNQMGTDLTPQSTQARHPATQQGGGFDGLGTSKLINFGGSSFLTATRGGINSLYNVKQLWNADRYAESADPVDVSKRMDNE